MQILLSVHAVTRTHHATLAGLTVTDLLVFSVTTSFWFLLGYQGCFFLCTQPSANGCRAPRITQIFKHILGNMVSLNRYALKQISTLELQHVSPLSQFVYPCHP